LLVRVAPRSLAREEFGRGRGRGGGGGLCGGGRRGGLRSKRGPSRPLRRKTRCAVVQDPVVDNRQSQGQGQSPLADRDRRNQERLYR